MYVEIYTCKNGWIMYVEIYTCKDGWICVRIDGWMDVEIYMY